MKCSIAHQSFTRAALETIRKILQTSEKPGFSLRVECLQPDSATLPSRTLGSAPCSFEPPYYVHVALASKEKSDAPRIDLAPCFGTCWLNTIFVDVFLHIFDADANLSSDARFIESNPPWPKSTPGLAGTRISAINTYCQVRLKTRSSHQSNLQKPSRIFQSFARVGAER